MRQKVKTIFLMHYVHVEAEIRSGEERKDRGKEKRIANYIRD